MHLLSLSLAQFLSLFGSIAVVAVALYLLDRSRRRQVVSTLQFWAASPQPAAAARRRRIRQPWSLILQLLAMALLLLAIAQLRIGARAVAGRDHVLILDDSAWMDARSGGGTVMDTARERARQYIRRLPARDRILLVRADALATPATGFESERAKLDEAIRETRPNGSALNLAQALAFAQRIQLQAGRVPGEIAYIGAARTETGNADAGDSSTPEIRNLRAILTPGPARNCGIRRVSMRRSASDPGMWEILATARNYGPQAEHVTVSADFKAGAETAALPSRQLVIPGGAEAEATFEYRASAPGTLEVDLAPHDAFPADDHAELEAPGLATLTVTVYSEHPELLRPVLASNPRIVAVYRTPSDYRADDAGLVVIDGFIPRARPVADSIWLDPPASGSPIPIRESVDGAKIVKWGGGPLSAGLRTRDFRVTRASVFEAAPDDIQIGEVEAGPVIVARPGNPKIVVFGFHPELSSTRYQLATPLLFADVQRWVAPEIFRIRETEAGSVGTIEFPVDKDLKPGDVAVSGSGGQALPFTLKDGVLRFFAGEPGMVKASANEREYSWSLRLPRVGEGKWEPPAGAALGLPRFAPIESPSTDLWPWLAAIAGGLLAAEWMLFAPFRRRRSARAAVPIRSGRSAVEGRP